MKKVLIAVGFFVVLGGLIFIAGFFYGFRVMNVPTGAMANTIVPGEKIAATRFFGEIKRGDVVVFKWPKNPESLFVMRVIGMPGESIEVRGRTILINGKELDEKRIKVDLSAESTKTNQPMAELAEDGVGEYRVFYDLQTWEGGEGFDHQMKFAVKSPFQIPPQHYFMLGDSRDNSMDSRFWGAVAKDAIVWKAYLIFTSSDENRTFQQIK